MASSSDEVAPKATAEIKKPPRFPPRKIHINDPAHQKPYNLQERYVNNSVRTTKYTLLSFLPKNLFEQFRRIANFYFLVSAAIQFVPGLSPLNPATSILPLAFVLAVTAIKEGVEDFRRYQSDCELNARPCNIVVDGSLRSVPWSDVDVGDIIYLAQDESIPADMVMLFASNPGGMGYVETANLDGETNLKLKQCIPATLALFHNHSAVSAVKGAAIECEGPTLNLYTFDGNFVEPSGRSIPVSPSQLLLRGCVLKNTPFVYGCVVYTGHETKLFLNAGAAPSKRTSLEKHLNRCVYIMFGFQAFIVALSCIGTGIWAQMLNTPSVSWYLQNSIPAGTIAGLAILTYIILYNVMIPISLYVSMEIVKLCQVLFIGQDLSMYYELNDTPANARTSNLNEELGQIEYIFSDKTGTLTSNIMEFMKCTVAGISYGKGITEIESVIQTRAGRPVKPTIGKIKGYNFDDPALLGNLMGGHPTAEAIKEFLTMLAVNHNVISEEDPPGSGKTKYQAASPDENALVMAAKYLGFEFITRTPDTVTIQVSLPGRQPYLETYKILNLLEFSSKRKRSSVIVVTPDGKLKLWCKGADNVIKERLDPERNVQGMLDITDKQLGTFADQGLRTLCFASTMLDQEAYKRWNVIFEKAATALVNREQEVEAACELIEQNLVMIGATAIEDKLQRGVPDAIQKLEDANIKVWMLTGDKQETAINIGYACNLIDNTFEKIIVNGDKPDMVRTQLEDNVKKFNGVTFESAKLGFIIDGFSLGFVMDDHIAEADAKLNRRPMKDMLMELSGKCRGVICCRMSPKQKALIVAMVKKSTSPSPVTLSIGDGANDVPMIQTAHVGVGISGEEGLQAVRAADFAIAQFRYLVPLLLVHGRWDYKRIAKIVLYSFYKNMTFSMTLFWFQLYCGFSGQTLYDSWHISLFNVIFTGAPIIVYSIFDKDVEAEMVLRYPRLYLDGQTGSEFSKMIFAGWIVRGIYHSVVCWFVPFMTFGGLPFGGNSSDIMPNGWGMDMWSFGQTVLYCVIITVNVELIIEHNIWNWLNVIGVGSAFFFLFAFTLIYSLIILISTDMYYVTETLMQSGAFWFAIILTPTIAVLPDVILKYVRRNYFFNPYHIVQEIQGGYGDQVAFRSKQMSTISDFALPAHYHHSGFAFDDPHSTMRDSSALPQTTNPLRTYSSRGSSKMTVESVHMDV